MKIERTKHILWRVLRTESKVLVNEELEGSSEDNDNKDKGNKAQQTWHRSDTLVIMFV